MNRADWQQMAEEKLLAADALLGTAQWASAYYLAGYAIECGLKSCILSYVETSGAIFEDKRYSEKCWTHRFDLLVDLAGLKPDLRVATAAAPALGANWAIASQWSEVARYKMNMQPEAEMLHNAINDPISGVMQWIRAHW